MKLTLAPIIYTLRGYSEDIPDEELGGSAYELVATVTIIGDEAHISGLLGSVTKKDYKKLMSMLKEKNISTLIYERRRIL